MKAATQATESKAFEGKALKLPGIQEILILNYDDVFLILSNIFLLYRVWKGLILHSKGTSNPTCWGRGDAVHEIKPSEE